MTISPLKILLVLLEKSLLLGVEHHMNFFRILVINKRNQSEILSEMISNLVQIYICNIMIC